LSWLINQLLKSLVDIQKQAILLVLYVADLLQLVKHHQLRPNVYTDDTYIYGFCNPADSDILQKHISNCFEEVTALILLGLSQCNFELHEYIQYRLYHGFHINSDVTLITLIAATVLASFSILRQIQSVQLTSSHDVLIVLIRALIISKVDTAAKLLLKCQ